MTPAQERKYDANKKRKEVQRAAQKRKKDMDKVRPYVKEGMRRVKMTMMTKLAEATDEIAKLTIRSNAHMRSAVYANRGLRYETMERQSAERKVKRLEADNARKDTDIKELRKTIVELKRRWAWLLANTPAKYRVALEEKATRRPRRVGYNNRGSN